MLQAARRAPKILGESTDLVRAFLLRQQNPDGGFKDRAGRSDLYYTVFGLDALEALNAELPWEGVAEYLRSCGEGDGLDFVRLCCLARAWNAVEGRAGCPQPAAFRQTHNLRRPEHLRIDERLEAFRARDGGYRARLETDSGTAYGAFLALGAYQDIGKEMPEPMRLVESLQGLLTPDGAWTNDKGIPVGSTNATAAAVTVLRNLGSPVNPKAGSWLLTCSHPAGGFLAARCSPMPDLLSTATALHALAGLQLSLERVGERCLDFIDSLWTNEGAFYGNWCDNTLDCEYTFYALLALGHLSG